ncbi:MAG: hypothetical protein U1F56_19660 [Rubrivivax sp.]
MRAPPTRRAAARAIGAAICAPLVAPPLLRSAAASESIKEKSMESAKRRVPKVKPLTHQGVRYEPLRLARENGFTQSGGVLAAVDIASGKTLWTRQLYQTAFDANEERDVQEVYIESLALDARSGSLIATDERRRRWRVQLADGATEALPPAAAKR